MSSTSSVINFNTLAYGKSSFLTAIVHQLFIVLLVFFGLVSCRHLNRGEAMEEDSPTQSLIFLPFRVQGESSAGFLVPIQSSAAVSLDYYDIFQRGVFLRHFNDVEMTRVSKAIDGNIPSVSFPDPEMINLFSIQDTALYIGPWRPTSLVPQNEAVTYDLSPSKTNIVLVLTFQMPSEIREQPFALVPDRNLVLNASGALSLTTYARNEQHLQEIMAMYPDTVFLPIYTSDEDPIGTPILQPFDENGRIPAFIVDLRRRAEMEIWK